MPTYIFRAPLITRIPPSVGMMANTSFTTGPNLVLGQLATVPYNLVKQALELPVRLKGAALAALEPIPQNQLLLNPAIAITYEFRTPLLTRVAPSVSRAPQNQFETNQLNLLLSLSPVNIYITTYWGLQYGWPTRQQPPDPVNMTILGIAAGPTPTQPIETPRPTLRRPTIFSESFGSFNLLKGIPAGAQPAFTPVDFPNPTLRRPTVFADSQGSTLLLSGFGVPPSPNTPVDFPNPSRFAFRPPDTSNTSFALYNTPQPVGQATDWATTPVRRTPWTAYFDPGQNLVISLILPTPSAGAGTGQGRYGGRVILPAKKLGETVFEPFDYISQLSAGESVVSATCSCVVYTGNDPNPSAVISGSPSFSGTIVNQLVTGGVLGTIYELRMTAVTSLGQTIELPGFLAIVPDLP